MERAEERGKQLSSGVRITDTMQSADFSENIGSVTDGAVTISVSPLL